MGLKNVSNFEPAKKRKLTLPAKTNAIKINNSLKTEFSKDEIIYNNLFHPQRGIKANTIKDSSKPKAHDPNYNKIMHHNKKLEICGILTYKQQKMIIISDNNSSKKTSQNIDSKNKTKKLKKESNLLKIGDKTTDGAQLIEIFRNKAVFKKNKQIIDIQISRKENTKINLLKTTLIPSDKKDQKKSQKLK